MPLATVLYVCSWEAQKQDNESEETFILGPLSVRKSRSSSVIIFFVIK